MAKKDFNKNANDNVVIGNEPEWNFSDFYTGPDDPRIEEDVQKLDVMTTAFAEKYRGKVTSLSAAELLQAMRDSDAVTSLYYKVACYASMLTTKSEEKYSPFEKKLNQRMTDILNKMQFFDLEQAKVPMADLQDKIAAEPGLDIYRVSLEQTVKMQPHQLSEETEQVLSKFSLSGSQAWVGLFDKMNASAKYSYNGKEVGQEEILNLRSSPDRAVREAATKSLYDGLNKNLWLMTYITNTLSLNAATRDEVRHMPGPVSSRNMSNNIDDDIVDAMNQSVNRGYPRVSHRYYELLRQILKLEKLKGWDRNAPFRKEEASKIPYEEAKKIVLESYRSFSPLLAGIIEKAFDNGWIDAKVTPGKRAGAYSMSCSYNQHPMVMLNYLGTSDDVATMAHELGHMCHQYLAGQNLKSDIAASTPLTIAETASVFGERVTFENLLAKETDSQKRIDLLAGKINDMIGTVVRQNAFFNFEKEMHAARKSRGTDLESKEINEIYLKTQKEALGPAFDLDEDYGIEWAYVPHFIHTPYYVYAYVFGDCLVNSLYRKYQEAADKEEFAGKYIKLLEAGGTKPATDLVKDFGLDLRDPTFWDGGMKAIEELIDKLEVEIAAQQKLEAKKPAKKRKSGAKPSASA